MRFHPLIEYLGTDFRLKKLVFPMFMAVVGALAVFVVITNVLATTPVTLKTLRVNDIDMKPGTTYTLPTGTESVVVDATPTDGAATITVTGDSGFKEGNNTLSIKVTGSDNKTFKIWTVTLVQPKLEGWCLANAEKIKLYNDDYDTADIYQMIELAYLDDGRLPEIQAHLTCFSDGLQKYIKANY